MFSKRRRAMNLRPAVPADALCIAMLGTQVFLNTYAPEGMRLDLAREVLAHFAPTRIEELLHNQSVTFVLAESAGHLMGFVQVTHGARHELVAYESTSEVDRLYVHERFTSQGIGKALLHRAEALAASHGSAALWLTAWVGNARAIAFYSKQGYADMGATDYVFEDEHYENRVCVKVLG
jgi:diamine N-acetyltransferase